MNEKEHDRSDVLAQFHCKIRENSYWRVSLGAIRLYFEMCEHVHQEWETKWYRNDFKTPKPWSDFYIKEAKEKESLFYHVHDLIKMILSVPATSAALERVFSCTGFLKSSYRS